MSSHCSEVQCYRACTTAWRTHNCPPMLSFALAVVRTCVCAYVLSLDMESFWYYFKAALAPRPRGLPISYHPCNGPRPPQDCPTVEEQEQESSSRGAGASSTATEHAPPDVPAVDAPKSSNKQQRAAASIFKAGAKPIGAKSNRLPAIMQSTTAAKGSNSGSKQACIQPAVLRPICIQKRQEEIVLAKERPKRKKPNPSDPPNPPPAKKPTPPLHPPPAKKATHGDKTVHSTHTRLGRCRRPSEGAGALGGGYDLRCEEMNLRGEIMESQN